MSEVKVIDLYNRICMVYHMLKVGEEQIFKARLELEEIANMLDKLVGGSGKAMYLFLIKAEER